MWITLQNIIKTGISIKYGNKADRDVEENIKEVKAKKPG